MKNPDYPDERQRPDGTVEPDANDNSTRYGVPSTSEEIAAGPPGETEMVDHE